MTWDLWLIFSIWRNATGNKKSDVTGQCYVLIYMQGYVYIFPFRVAYHTKWSHATTTSLAISSHVDKLYQPHDV